MRIKFGNKIFECNYVRQLTERFVYVCTCENRQYTIDCEEKNYVTWLMSILLTKGFFDASGVDYDNSNDQEWVEYCNNKTEEQKVFGKWINRK